MEIQELLSLLKTLLKDEVVGKVEEKNGELVVTFLDGKTRIVTVK